MHLSQRCTMAVHLADAHAYARLLSDETAVAATVSGGSISDWVLKHYGSRLLTAPTAMSSSTFYSGLVLVGRPCVAGYLPDEDWFPDDGRVFWARCTLLSLR